MGPYLQESRPKIYLPVANESTGYIYFDFQPKDDQRRQIANDYFGNCIHLDGFSGWQSELESSLDKKDGVLKGIAFRELTQ